MAETRTPAELQESRFNYFVAFGISLTETDDKKITDVIKKAASNTSSDVYKARLVQLKDDALAVMTNPSTRSQEATNAKNMKLQEGLQGLQELARGRKALFTSEINECWKRENNTVQYYTEQELRSGIEALLKKSGTGTTIQDNMDESLPIDKYREINKYLFTMGNTDLYEFLGQPQSANEAALRAANDARYGSLNTIKDRNKKTAADRLCSAVKEQILNPTGKKNYDRYLLLKADVWDKFELRHAGDTIAEGAYLDFINIIKTKLGVSVEEASKICAIGCRVFRLTPEGDATAGVEICPFCKKMFKKGPKSCPHCGKSFVSVCWNCGGEKPMTNGGDSACPTCNATNNTKTLYTNQCTKIETLKRSIPIAAAIRTKEEASKARMAINDIKAELINLKNLCKACGGKTEVEKKYASYEKEFQSLADAITKKVKEIDDLEVRLRQAYETAYTEVKTEITQKNLVKATTMVAALASNPKFAGFETARTQMLRAEIDRAFAMAKAQVSTANQMAARNATPGMIISYAVKALELCADYEDAKQIIRKYPPKPVTNIRGNVVGNNIRVEWDDNLNQGVTYKVIKKVGVAPTNPADGQVVAENLSLKFCEDRSVISGTPYYYAVCAEQKITDSFKTTSMILVLRVALTVYTDVTGVQQDLVYGGVKVSWDTPNNVKSVEVWKNKGPVAPMAPGQGTKVACDAKGFYDQTAEGDNGYLIVCNYLVNGQTVRSKGVQFVYKPFVKTSPLEEEKFTTIGEGNYLFTCKAGYVGKIRLYTSDKKLTLPTGQMLKYADFNDICKGLVPLASTMMADGGLSFTIPMGKICYVYPVVSTDQLFVVSQPQLFNRAEGLQQYSHTVSNGTVTVSGMMHPRATAIIATVSTTKYIEKLEGCTEKYTFKRAEFEGKGGKLDIKLRANSTNYITLFPEFAEGMTVTYSTPIKIDPPIENRESVTVYYKMDYNVSAMKKFKVTLEFEAEQEVEIPKLLLMYGAPCPLNKTAGNLAQTIDPIKLRKGLFSKKYTAKQVIELSPLAPNVKFAIFPSDDNSYVKLRRL